MTRPVLLHLECLLQKVILLERSVGLTSVAPQKNKSSKRPSPQAVQVIPPSMQPTYEPIDLAKVPPPVKPTIDRDYVASENLDLQKTPAAIIQDRLGVAAYPTVDLTKDLPGVPPTDDFSKAKAQNQIGHDAFLKAIEPYFRPFNEEDLTFLRQQVIILRMKIDGRVIILRRI
jgi:hypothetical protein